MPDISAHVTAPAVSRRGQQRKYLQPGNGRYASTCKQLYPSPKDRRPRRLVRQQGTEHESVSQEFQKVEAWI
ncbi:hypothetical protein VUR80DRAFT_10319 [Thermomyces stellatus]